MKDIPIIVTVDVDSRGDAGAIDTEYYCVNTTKNPVHVASRSESFTTVDEETGAAVSHGSPPTEIEIASGEAVKLGDVAGWEWDGAVAIEVTYREAGVRASYNLKDTDAPYTVPGTNQPGRIVPPETLSDVP